MLLTAVLPSALAQGPSGTCSNYKAEELCGRAARLGRKCTWSNGKCIDTPLGVAVQVVFQQRHNQSCATKVHEKFWIPRANLSALGLADQTCSPHKNTCGHITLNSKTQVVVNRINHHAGEDACGLLPGCQPGACDLAFFELNASIADLGLRAGSSVSLLYSS